MELVLIHQTQTEISVSCNGQPSHVFDLRPLMLKDERELTDNPVGYGKKLSEALFPPNTPAQRALATQLETPPGYLLLVAVDSDLDAIPWEYVYGPDGFLVLECHFVRGLPADQRIDPPVLESGLHIVAVPSNPLSHKLEPLNIDGEWMRLKEIIHQVPSAITLERTRPSTIEQVRRLVANQRNRIVHFMGHGGQFESGAALLFEQDNGDLAPVTAKEFIHRVRGAVFLVTLNACVSAAPGPTNFSNFAVALVQQKTPYTLGMRLSIADEDARTFSREFYSELAHGIAVEEALYQTRLSLAKSPCPWVVGVPILYTSLRSPSTGFVSLPGTPTIKEHQSRLEVSILPRTEGIFQGRIEELKRLGTHLTGDNRPYLLTIHGGGGQGKTALAREAVERFGYAWLEGVWATSLENLPSREQLVNDLARFMGIDTQKVVNPVEIESLVVAQLSHRRTLIVLDNAETLVEAIEANNKEAIRLAQLLREQLPRPQVSLLATSRSFLGWAGEIGCELTGLIPIEGVRLFQQHAPQREKEVEHVAVWRLSEQLEGHPLSLRLLGLAFNASSISFSEFVKEYEARLLNAENRYKDVDHPHRTLYACVETSVRYLEEEQRALLSGLWVFHASFHAETATGIFGQGVDAPEGKRSQIPDQLRALWLCGLLTREGALVGDRIVQLYRLFPVVRSYVERYLEQVCEREALLTRFGMAYAHLASQISSEMDRTAAVVYLARQAYEDLDRGIAYVGGMEQGHYLLQWGQILARLGDIRHAQELIERALEIVQGQSLSLELGARNQLALICLRTGQPLQALELFDQVLRIMRRESEPAGEAILLNNMALAYAAIGQLQRALEMYNQALVIQREVGNQAEVATLLNNMAWVNKAIGQRQQALQLLEQSLAILHEMGDLVREASTLNNIATVYENIGQRQQSLELLERALTIQHEMGDLAEEASTLNNLAGVYHTIGQPQRALALYEQALSIQRQIGDRPGEATTLNALAVLDGNLGQWQRALGLFEQALPIRQEVGDRLGEATTLNGIARVYQAMGQPQRTLELLEQALSIQREVGDRPGEAITLNAIAGVYQASGQWQRALEFYEQTLSMRYKIGDKGGEAAVLNNMAGIYKDIGQRMKALELLEQALTIADEVGNQSEKAIILSNLGGAYHVIGQPKQSLQLYTQALSIQREVGDRPGEAAILHGMATVYLATGQSQQALELLEQTLPISQEMGDRSEEAATLSSIGDVHRVTGQWQQALELYTHALSIQRAVGDRHGEATSLNNMAVVYSTNEQWQRALEPLEQSLSIMREVGNRVGEAGVLNNIGKIYQATGQPQQVLELLEQSLSILHEVEDPAQEVTVLVNMAFVLYQQLDRPQEAITRLKQAIEVLVETDLPQDASGHTVALLKHLLGIMRMGGDLNQWANASAILPSGHLERIINSTITVMTVSQGQRSMWREGMLNALQVAQQEGVDRQSEVDFYNAVIAILDGQIPALPESHPYAKVVAAITDGITASEPHNTEIPDEIMQALGEFVNAEGQDMIRQVIEARQAALFLPEVEMILEHNIARAKAAGDLNVSEIFNQRLILLRACQANGIVATFEHLTELQQGSPPFDHELIFRSISALLGNPQEKMAHAQYLLALATQTTDEGLKALLTTIQLALFGGDLSKLGHQLSGLYLQAWESIIVGVETKGIDLHLLATIASNTLAVLDSAANKREEWRDSLTIMRSQGMVDGEHQFVALLDAIVGLLDAKGKPTGLGEGLTGIYAKIWQAIAERIP